MNINIDDNIIYTNDIEFLGDYLELLVNRITHSNMSLEHDLGNPDNSINAIRLNDNMKAFHYLIKNLSIDISEELIKKTANLVNESNKFISNDYRTLGDYIANTDIPISNKNQIKDDLKNLINDYKNNWNNLTPMEKEAKFHIEFIRIHPFEDGNGRTARLILNYNLLKQQIAPVIITDDLIEYYQTYIKENDVTNMANIFTIQAHKENEILKTLYLKNRISKKEKLTNKEKTM